MRWDRDYKNPEVINDPTIIPAYGVTDEERARWNAKQDALEYDPVPTPYSDKHMISGAIYNALEQYKLTTTQLCQAFFWGQVGGLGEIKTACDADALRAEAAKDTAVLSAGAAYQSETAAAESAGSASYSASQALISKNSAEYAAGQAADQVGLAAAQVALAEGKVLDAEAYALGTREGVPVDEDDPAYHHNAKYYADISSEAIQDDVISLYTTWSSSKLTTDFATVAAVTAALTTKADLVSGRVPAAQLPSYVDDVVNGYLYNGDFYEDPSHTVQILPESGKIYVDLSTDRTYRWSGSVYVEISPSIVIGEIAGTAYEGNKGKANTNAIIEIVSLIPGDASPSNKLATANDVPTALEDLTDDATHRLVTDAEKAGWDSKAAGNHTHDDRYYTETEINAMFNGVTFTTSDNEIYINW